MSDTKKVYPSFGKRIVAYVIDFLIVAIISSFISVFFINENEYTNSLNELSNILIQEQNKEISYDEYVKKYDDIKYDISKTMVNFNVIMAIVGITYYSLICYKLNGKTIGKKLMKMHIKGYNNKNISVLNYLVRTLYINLNLLFIIDSMMVVFLSKSNYNTYQPYMSNVLSSLVILSLFFISFNDNRRGLHDIITGTVVINDNSDIEIQYIEKKED